jgi:hypothetical protein
MQVFDDSVRVSNQALARRQRFQKNKTSMPQIITGTKNSLPKVWFDDQGEIQAVTTDPEFQPDTTWKTYDFDNELIIVLTDEKSPAHTVKQYQNKDGKIEYKLVPRDTIKSRHLTHDAGMILARHHTVSDILIQTHKNSVIVELTEFGKQKLTSQCQDITIYVTEPLNAHYLWQSLKIDIKKLAKGKLTFKTPDYTKKSIYGQKPWAYGRI